MIKTKRLYQSTMTGGQILGDVGREVLIMFMGGRRSFGTSNKVAWILRSKLICNNQDRNWDVYLFCNGVLEKHSERITDDNGSWSIVTEKMVFLDWLDGAWGIIMERGDTIERFHIIMDPVINPILRDWSVDVFIHHESPIESVSGNRWYLDYISRPAISYGIIGTFHNQHFVLITNGDIRRMYVYTDEELRMIFQRDCDDLPVKKRDHISPFILLDSNIPDSVKSDWLRLSILSRCLNDELIKNSIPY